MSAEHRRHDGIYQGFFCGRCGAPGVNMLGTGHGEGKCEPNFELVEELMELNSITPYVAIQVPMPKDPALPRQEATAYWADLGFRTAEGNERGHKIHFLAASDEEAVRAAFRWAANRRHAWNNLLGDKRSPGEHDHLNLKVGLLVLQTITPSGYLPLTELSGFYEWKCDTGERGTVRVGAPASMFDIKPKFPGTQR